tara:strand:- start:41 stop:1507 length:1467 start_codon:yes stop_codon:yes gene_type:complete
MANLSSYLGGQSDPRKEGLPLFGLWGQESGGNHNTNFRIFDSGFRNVGSPWGGSTGTTSNYRYGVMADASHAYSMNDHGTDFNSNHTTESYTSYTNYCKSTYQIDQYPHAFYYTASRNGHCSWQSYHQITSSFEYTVGWTKLNMVLPEGQRPRRLFCNRRNSMREKSGNNSCASIDHYDYTSHLLETTNDYATGTGYNEKTKTLVMIHSGGEGDSAAKTIHIFKSGKNLMSCKKIKEFFDELTSVEYFTDSWPLPNNKNWCVVVGNNDWVGFGAKTGNTKKYCAFDCSVKGVGQNLTGASRRYLDWQDFAGSTTTSYSAENGNQYYTRFNTTWDGKWGMIFSPYYYYGPGINAFAMSLENPRKFISINQTKSAYPNPYTAWGRTGFHGGDSDNTDSTSWQTYSFSFDPTDSDHTVDTTVYMGSSSGEATVPDSNSHVGGSYANKTGSCSLTESYTQLTGGFNSTCYPVLIGLNWWGAYGSADASYGGQ